ncbi:methyltransferase domain-containing protein [Ramlibacter solisilvae]|uniref:Biotin synthase n=1 Tax=Ramlibacter tataouinensis TaxID=94132 RepID=A0A127JS40_9BURK|nr:methyltransferase domain-containing protein [Ramlibacter tataouinensis]AMO22796.1 biotin synthase [Ramlibacter tataouinensis]
MTADRPPTIDPVAARRWAQRAPARPPWLHEEVGRRMAERLQWIRLEPEAWADWEPVRGGLEAHALVAARYPKARRWIVEREPRQAASAKAAIKRAWWRPGAPALEHGPVPDGAARMLWSNMALHMAADPQELIARWHRALAVDGFLMFSCLGPDTVRELKALHASQGWPPPAHDFTDMHDWGDMLIHAGFAEPVMDMERIVLTWESPGRMVEELRELGANLHPARFGGLRGHAWRRGWDEQAGQFLRGADGRLSLTFEIIYGHALKPPPKVRLAGESAVSVQDLQALLRSGRKPR